MPNPQNLNLLRQLREISQLTQADMATFFGFGGHSARTRMGKWENGTEIPPVKHRAKFIQYLVDKLGLRFHSDTFDKVWQVIHEEWKWPLLSSSERSQYLSSSVSPTSQQSRSDLADVRLREIDAELGSENYDDENTYRAQVATMYCELDFVGIPELKERRPVTLEDVFIPMRIEREPEVIVRPNFRTKIARFQPK